MPSSLLILHRGLRRDMKQFSYTKQIPKLPPTTKPTFPCSTTLLYQNAELRSENALLQKQIHKEEQLQRMYNQITPDLNRCNMTELDYSQLMQIHLLMKLEEKEKELAEKEKQLEVYNRCNQEAAEAVSNQGITHQVALYSALLQPQQLQKCLTTRQSTLAIYNRKLASLKKTKQTLKNNLLHTQAELASIQQQMQESRARLPKSIETSLRDNDTPNGKLKPRNIQELQREVSAIEKECEAIGCRLQLAVDQYIVRKIQLRGEIDSL